jgi:hypothetical protein
VLKLKKARSYNCAHATQKKKREAKKNKGEGAINEKGRGNTHTKKEDGAKKKKSLGLATTASAVPAHDLTQFFSLLK